MAAGLAHELNQPLGVIQMATGNMLRRIEKHGLDETYAAGKLERIAGQTERASKIIDHMRIFARRDDQRTEPFNLRNAVQSATTMMRAQLSGSGIDLDETLDCKDMQATGSKVMFEQVLVNLLANARDAILERVARDGDATPKRISVSVVTEGDGATIIVSDTGGGMPEEIRARLFEPFFTTKAPGKGTGLGLSISYGIIQNMGGEINASNVNDGSRFTINLPVAA
jgi:C4-dicarboxylate-specific signal transduction histidine kinase